MSREKTASQVAKSPYMNWNEKNGISGHLKRFVREKVFYYKELQTSGESRKSLHERAHPGNGGNEDNRPDAT